MAARYVDRPRKRHRVSYAARYEQGNPLGDLREIAQKADRSAELAEVPALGALGVLAVRYLLVPDDHPAYTDYEIIPEGHYLVYSEDFGLLYASDPETFAREHQSA